MAEMTKKTRDRWDKLDIILKFAGGVMTALSVALVGFLGSRFLAQRQDVETDSRLYTELMSHREEADTSLRKEMFNSIIKDFLMIEKTEPSNQPDKMILGLELLAYNFHDSLDLGPLFKDVYRHLYKKPLPERNKQYLDRLAKVTRDVIGKQIEMLEEAGAKLDGTIDLNEMKKNPGSIKIIDDSIPVKVDDGRQYRKKVCVEALGVDPEKRELRVRLRVWSPQNNGETEADALFWVGFSDFPMLDNVRLPQGYRCSIALREFQDESAEITFVHFPSSRASLKEKLFYDEILYNLRNPPQRQNTNPPR